MILLAVPPAPPCATALLIVRLAIEAVPACTKKARPALLASRVLPLPVTVTLLVIMGSDCVSWKLPVKLMVVSALPPLMAKIAVRSDASLLTSCAQAGAAVSAVAASRAVANVVSRYAAADGG